VGVHFTVVSYLPKVSVGTGHGFFESCWFIGKINGENMGCRWR